MYQHFPLHGDILAARHFLYYSLILPPTKLKKRVENWGRKEVKKQYSPQKSPNYGNLKTA